MSDAKKRKRDVILNVTSNNNFQRNRGIHVKLRCFRFAGNDYLVIGHEDPVKQRLMINVESIVENWWNKGKAWSRTVKKYFRKKCH